MPLRIAASLARNTSGAPMTRIATYPTVHGPTPGKRQELGPQPADIIAIAKVQVPGGHRRGGATDGINPPLRAAQQFEARLRDLGGRGEQPVEAVGRHEALAPGRGQLNQRGARGGHRDLLADHGPDQEFLRVNGARHPHARRGGHRRGQAGIAAQRGIDGDRIGVEVQQPPDPAQQGGRSLRSTAPMVSTSGRPAAPAS